MKLDAIQIKNFRSIDSIRVKFDKQVTVFHGPNASGKTTLLEGIAIGLQRIIQVIDPNSGPGLFHKGCDNIRIDVTASDKDLGEEITWEFPRDDGAVHGPQHGESIARAFNVNSQDDMPLLFRYYSAHRTARTNSGNEQAESPSLGRLAAHRGAWSGEIVIKDFLAWFEKREHQEFLQQKSKKDFNATLPELDALRHALQAMMPELSKPQFRNHPETREPQFVVSETNQDRDELDTREILQLAGGYQVMFALVADLVSRMVQANPDKDNPLESEAVVLIDEIDLHLHPSWQQRIIPDLCRTFPGVQFIITTHSPQVLSTLMPPQIVPLIRTGNKIDRDPRRHDSTFGAKAGDILADVMQVPERPDENEFTKEFKKYTELIKQGRGETDEALKIRLQLEQWSPRDPGLHAAKLEIMRRRVLGA